MLPSSKKKRSMLLLSIEKIEQFLSITSNDNNNSNNFNNNQCYSFATKHALRLLQMCLHSLSLLTSQQRHLEILFATTPLPHQ